MQLPASDAFFENFIFSNLHLHARFQSLCCYLLKIANKKCSIGFLTYYDHDMTIITNLVLSFFSDYLAVAYASKHLYSCENSNNQSISFLN